MIFLPKCKAIPAATTAEACAQHFLLVFRGVAHADQWAKPNQAARGNAAIVLLTCSGASPIASSQWDMPRIYHQGGIHHMLRPHNLAPPDAMEHPGYLQGSKFSLLLILHQSPCWTPAVPFIHLQIRLRWTYVNYFMWGKMLILVLDRFGWFHSD